MLKMYNEMEVEMYVKMDAEMDVDVEQVVADSRLVQEGAMSSSAVNAFDLDTIH